MKKVSNILWGILLVAAGVLLALRAMDVLQFNIFFDGWWTLIIIIPCTIGFFTEKGNKTDNLIGVGIGVILLLCCWDILSFKLLGKLLVPGIVVVIGLKLVLGGLFGGKANKMLEDVKAKGKSPNSGCGVFSGVDMKLEGEVFEGAELTAVFGGVQCDLRGAIIEKDCAIKVSAIFGGIDILVSDNVNVKVDATGIFGGVSNKTASKKNVPTIFVTGLCMFGGVDVK